MNLIDFRLNLQQLMTEPDLRPFVCNGSPLDCKVFIVGFNPATTIGNPFWSYWNDRQGFDKGVFMEDYFKQRELKGVRPRIERIVSQLPSGICLETNICSRSTKTAAELKPADQKTDIFLFLLKTIKPRIVFCHSNQPILFFERLTGMQGFSSGTPKAVSWEGQEFLLLGSSGPLFRMGFDQAEEVGQTLSSYL